MFAIRRTIALLGTAQVSLLPSEIQNQLRTLHSLCFIDDPQEYRDEALSTAIKKADRSPRSTEDNHSDTHSANEPGSHGDFGSPSKRRGTDAHSDDCNISYNYHSV
jgi:hypothetical protein